MGASNFWLRRKYTKLENFKLISTRKVDEDIEFLNQNPNIRTFSARIQFLAKNMHFLKESNIHLDVLNIQSVLCSYPRAIEFSNFVDDL